jgi:hypothetical protein
MRWLMENKLTLNYLETALVDILAVSKPTTNLETSVTSV